jgi:Flp pilus assembly pilin Flp
MEKQIKSQMRRKARRGQGMTEYIIVVALVAIAAIGVITVFGDNIRRMFGNAADALSGETSMKYTYTPAGQKATTSKGLQQFANDNTSVY